MKPRLQVGSRQLMPPSSCVLPMTCSTSARVAHGGVGKSSRLSDASARWAITACDRFCKVPSVESGQSDTVRLLFSLIKSPRGGLNRLRTSRPFFWTSFRLLPRRQRTNVWREATSPARGARLLKAAPIDGATLTSESEDEAA